MNNLTPDVAAGKPHKNKTMAKKNENKNTTDATGSTTTSTRKPRTPRAKTARELELKAQAEAVKQALKDESKVAAIMEKIAKQSPSVRTSLIAEIQATLRQPEAAPSPEAQAAEFGGNSAE